MKKNGFKLGKTERAILAFARKLGCKPFYPHTLIEEGYKGDKRTLYNTLPRLARKGFLKKLYKGLYKTLASGSRAKITKEEKAIQAPRKKLTPDEWRMRIDAAMEKASEEVTSSDKKIEDCHQAIKEAQADIEAWKAERKKAESRLEDLKKLHETFLKAPEGFGRIVEGLLALK